MSETTRSGGATAARPLLALKGMSKSFGAVEAMKDVDLEVRPGEVMGLVGDNGAGKSTLIKAIAGVQPADVGEATFAGQQRLAGLAPGRHWARDRDRLPGPRALREPRHRRQPLPRAGGLGRQPLRPRRDGDGAEDGGTARLAGRDHDPQRPHGGRAALGWPAPGDRDRALAARRAQARPARRADRSTRRGPDARTSSS